MTSTAVRLRSSQQAIQAQKLISQKGPVVADSNFGAGSEQLPAPTCLRSLLSLIFFGGSGRERGDSNPDSNPRTQLPLTRLRSLLSLVCPLSGDGVSGVRVGVCVGVWGWVGVGTAGRCSVYCRYLPRQWIKRQPPTEHWPCRQTRLQVEMPPTSAGRSTLACSRLTGR